MYIILGPVVDHGGHLSSVSTAEVHASSSAVQLAELLASLADCWSVDNWS